jgi:hypothetical protein
MCSQRRLLAVVSATSVTCSLKGLMRAESAVAAAAEDTPLRPPDTASDTVYS